MRPGKRTAPYEIDKKFERNFDRIVYQASLLELEIRLQGKVLQSALVVATL
jgi:hypothetical protein